MREEIKIDYGAWSLDDFVKRANVPPSDLDIAEEQIKYDSMYQLLHPKLVNEVSHDVGTIDTLHMESWPRKTSSPILVVGCGGGQGLRTLHNYGFLVRGIDISREVAKYYADIPHMFQTAPSHKIPFEDGYFSTILCSDVLEHVREDLIDATFKEFKRVCRHTLALWVCCDVSGGIKDMHLTIKPPEWWKAKFEEYGTITAELKGEARDGAKEHYGAMVEL